MGHMLAGCRHSDVDAHRFEALLVVNLRLGVIPDRVIFDMARPQEICEVLCHKFQPLLLLTLLLLCLCDQVLKEHSPAARSAEVNAQGSLWIETCL